MKVLNDLNRIIDDIDDHHEYEIIFGDFNFIWETELDSDGGNTKLKYSFIAALQSPADSCDMIDIWRCRNPNSIRFTFRQPTALIQRRLDYIFISNTMQEAVEIDIISAIKTDHSADILNILPQSSFKRGPSYWKFNNSLLSDKSYVELIQREIYLILTDPFQKLTDPRARWESLKYMINVFTRNYLTNRTKNRNKDKTQLENKQKKNILPIYCLYLPHKTLLRNMRNVELSLSQSMIKNKIINKLIVL